VDTAGQLAGSDPDYAIKDLFEAIATGKPVSLSWPLLRWSLKCRTSILWTNWDQGCSWIKFSDNQTHGNLYWSEL